MHISSAFFSFGPKLGPVVKGMVLKYPDVFFRNNSRSDLLVALFNSLQKCDLISKSDGLKRKATGTSLLPSGLLKQAFIRQFRML